MLNKEYEELLDLVIKAKTDLIILQTKLCNLCDKNNQLQDLLKNGKPITSEDYD